MSYIFDTILHLHQGMKFAFFEIKMALIKLLTNFEILPSPQTPDWLEFSEGIIRVPKNGVQVVLKKRQYAKI